MTALLNTAFTAFVAVGPAAFGTGWGFTDNGGKNKCLRDNFGATAVFQPPLLCDKPVKWHTLGNINWVKQQEVETYGACLLLPLLPYVAQCLIGKTKLKDLPWKVIKRDLLTTTAATVLSHLVPALTGFDISGHMMVKATLVMMTMNSMSSLNGNRGTAISKAQKLGIAAFNGFMLMASTGDGPFAYNTAANSHTRAQIVAGIVTGAALCLAPEIARFASSTHKKYKETQARKVAAERAASLATARKGFGPLPDNRPARLKEIRRRQALLDANA